MFCAWVTTRNFPTHILGWHEFEQAATDPHIRRVYMDTIAGRAQVRALEEEAKAVSARICNAGDGKVNVSNVIK